ncbi:TonB-dependent receptor [Alcanivorax sp. 97CO-5]|jgi:hypothetical protein|uniref:carboxypeptidase-like regulatory domain-containing protein n=1 Tax=unclassified Alcanivorax TaxID=2638842 RepID=UPI0003E7E120|nr:MULTISPECIES: carboxypeptidase-like regulatory domain-containing protein [unclassified Alcanivorax]EUC71677.1 TonB-dependent receptor [Alcanivorax sp. 97CO-5]PKG03096.1 carboxypeptidase regulatory-like domain-containing protein [Alcanivorax sp. 97CO-6]
MSSLKKSFACPLIIVSLMLLLAGCIPTIQRMWDAQPVTGTVVDGNTGEPISGATIRSITLPEDPEQTPRTAISNAKGEFTLPGESHIGFHMAMPASYMASTHWKISHPDYPDAVAETRTIAPPTGEQPRNITVPLFAEINASKVQDCPYFHYQQQLAQWLNHLDEEARYPFQDSMLTFCHDSERIEQIFSAQERGNH